jgi:hypothetical protein
VLKARVQEDLDLLGGALPGLLVVLAVALTMPSSTRSMNDLGGGLLPCAPRPATGTRPG